jgi:cytochrome P450
MELDPYDPRLHQDPYRRLEARVAFEELLERLPDYRMTESRVRRTGSGPIRGALSLPV